MSRTISVTNLAEIDAPHLHIVTMVNMQFDTPLYAHSGVGTITYNSNPYLGVGELGSVGQATESETLEPTTLPITLSGVSQTNIAEALDSGNYGDIVTIYEGYRLDNGELVDDPWIFWKGTFEYSSIDGGEENRVSFLLRHDLAVLKEKDGGRFSHEDHQQRYSGDNAFEYVHNMLTVAKTLFWGGKINPAYPGGNGSGGPTFQVK